MMCRAETIHRGNTTRNPMNKDLYVKNISFEASEDDLQKLFTLMGKVTYIHMVTDPKSGKFLGCAYVKMANESQAKDALELDGTLLLDRLISVSEALPQRPKELQTKKHAYGGKNSFREKGAKKRDQPGQQQSGQSKNPRGHRK